MTRSQMGLACACLLLGLLFSGWWSAQQRTGEALRVDLGEPESYGRNWWCVLYPGLCMAACSGYDTPAENDLVCGEYILRFACVDWWQTLTARREDRSLLSLG